MFADRSQFYKPNETEQRPDQVVDVSGWAIGSTFTPYPDGTRAKFDVYCPDPGAYPFLIPRHRYLFKKTFERKGGFIYYEQFWIEIIAYKLGRLLDIPVPPAFVASYSAPGKGIIYASLIEWYYNYPNEAGCLVNRGGDFMSRAIPDYDRKKGGQHNFETIIKPIFTDWLTVRDWQNKWARMLLFDAIIGNTDRHQENWEIYSYFANVDLIEELSPAFDNGTSMGYDILSEKLANKLANLEAYVKKGTHHMMWSLGDDRHAGHIELLEKLVARFPKTAQAIRAKLQIDISPIAADIAQLTEYALQDERYKLSKERANFITQLIEFRYSRLRKMFGL